MATTRDWTDRDTARLRRIVRLEGSQRAASAALGLGEYQICRYLQGTKPRGNVAKDAIRERITLYLQGKLES